MGSVCPQPGADGLTRHSRTTSRSHDRLVYPGRATRDRPLPFIRTTRPDYVSAFPRRWTIAWYTASARRNPRPRISSKVVRTSTGSPCTCAKSHSPAVPSTRSPMAIATCRARRSSTRTASTPCSAAITTVSASPACTWVCNTVTWCVS